MKLYKLTKGSVSVIRRDEAGIKEAEAKGFTFDGEVEEVNGEYVRVYPKAETPEKKSKGRRYESPDHDESDGE